MRARTIVWPAIIAATCALAMEGAAVAQPAEGDWCKPDVLRTAKVSVRLDVRRQRFDDWIATSTTTLHVPVEWPRINELIWKAEETDGQRAMRCLLGPTDADERHGKPTVAVEDEFAVVTDVVRMTVNDLNAPDRLGYWRVDLGRRPWSFSLIRDHLPEAHWRSVTVVSAIPIDDAKRVPDRGATTRTLSWLGDPTEGAPEAQVWLHPPGQLALATWTNRGVHWLVGNLAWGVADVLVYLIVLSTALRLRRRAHRSDSRKGAVTWLIGSVGLLAVGHLLVFVGSLVTEVGWGNLGHGTGAYGNWVAVGEAAVWVVLLAATAAFFWKPWLVGWRLPAFIVVACSAVTACAVWLLLVLSAMEAGAAWDPGLTRPVRVDNVPIAVGMVAGLLAGALFAGVSMRVWRAGWRPVQVEPGEPPPTPSRAVALAFLIPGFLLALLSPLQFAAYLQARDRTLRWLWDSDWDWLWDDILSYPRWMSDMVVFQFWTVVVLAILAVLRQRTPADAPLTKDDQRLGAFLFVLVAVYWPDWYAGLSFPLAALVTFGTLVILLRWWRPPALIDSSEATTVETADLRSQAASYAELETRARGLDHRWSSGDPFLGHESYKEELEELRSEIRSCREAVKLDDETPVTPVDLFLASGREDNPWANGVACARAALGPALLATILMLLVGWQDNRWKPILAGWFGPAELLLRGTGELIFWLGMAFVLGYLWRVLPGTRGLVKPMPLIAAYIAGAVAHYLLVRLLGQTATEDVIPRILLMFVFLTFVAVIRDLHTLNEIRDAWASRLGLLATVYRVGTASTTAAFLLAQVAAAFALWQQLRSGVGAEPPPIPTPRSAR